MQTDMHRVESITAIYQPQSNTFALDFTDENAGKVIIYIQPEDLDTFRRALKNCSESLYSFSFQEVTGKYRKETYSLDLETD